MAVACFLLACFVLSLLQLHSVSAEKTNESQMSCPKSFDCGKFGPISFPFSNSTYPQCGLCTINCYHHPFPQIQLGNEGPWFDVKSVDYNVRRDNNNRSELQLEVEIHDQMLQSDLDNRNCHVFSNLTFPNSPSISFTISKNLTLFKCNKGCEPDSDRAPEFFNHFPRETCEGFELMFYKHQAHQEFLPPDRPQCCSVVQLPMSRSKHRNPNTSNPFELLTATFFLQLHVSKDCFECRHRGGQCQNHNQTFLCPQMRKEERTLKLKLVLATVIIGGFIIMVFLLVFITCRCKKWNHLPKNPNSNPSLETDNERTMSTMFFGVPVFSYGELEQATNNFDPSKELGDGGFGIVYHGKLQDGRDVAVKRLYEHNCKRMRQFLNEVEILTRLHHQNLVSLYGCTSRHSRELLLVYEYIPNGTVADHLHGDRAKYGLLTWPIRMNIALETASALSYLHASDIIHRDVKTSNILLDNNYGVKVADFGISRLFPTDVSHVSTAPQGTPGYVDPEYHQCYQLTNKSDVYSFGVVLIELISSMPAVDIDRNRHEINLATLAINRIQTRPLNELIDPSLGFQSDSSIETMISSVAEVAFQCLQYEREIRPTMDEVLEALKEIHKYKDDNIGEEHDSNFVLLNSGNLPNSPDFVTNRELVALDKA